MNIEILINRLAESLLTPPGLMFAMIAFGLIIIRRYYATGKFFLITGSLFLFIASLPITSHLLLVYLESEPALTEAQIKTTKARAIVVLGGGRYADAPEYNNRDLVSMAALERLRYAVYLQKKTHLPILVTGGSPGGEVISEATLMNQALKNTFKTSAKWLEKRSINTWENAILSAKILQKQNIHHILLVTHANHMRRSRMAFEAAGLKVTVAPLGFKARNKKSFSIFNFLPSGGGFSQLRSTIHEIIGYAWYLVRY